MTELVRVLIVEDSKFDAELLLLELRHGLSCIEFERVETVEAFSAALDRQPWDIVICDYHLPMFGVLPALALVRQRESYLPFIIVSGAIGEEFVVEAMKLGANDYVVKSNLARLLPAVKRELAANAMRKKRALAEKALRDSAAKFRGLVEQAADGIFVADEKSRFVLVNARFCEMTGYGEKELLGLGVADTYPEVQENIFRQDGRQSLHAVSHYVECMTRRKDGSLFPAEISVKLLDNGHSECIVRDITERKQLEQMRADSEQCLHELSENIRDVLFLIDTDMSRVRYVSPACEEIWGRSRDSLCAVPGAWIDAIHPEDRDRVVKLMQEQISSGRVECTYRILRPDGAARWIYARAYPVLDSAGSFFRIAGVAVDVTGRQGGLDTATTTDVPILASVAR